MVEVNVRIEKSGPIQLQALLPQWAPRATLYDHPHTHPVYSSYDRAGCAPRL